MPTLLTCLSGSGSKSRSIELDIDIGADAKDWAAVQAGEKLKPVETELRRIEEVVTEIVDELEYLRTREHKLRDTNESTNERVKWFAIGTMGTLVGLGVWQIIYLRAYFRCVHPASQLTCSSARSDVLWLLLTTFLGPSISSKTGRLSNLCTAFAWKKGGVWFSGKLPILHCVCTA